MKLPAVGMKVHITKPIDPDLLFTTLQRWITPEAKHTQPNLMDMHAEALMSESDAFLPVS